MAASPGFVIGFKCHLISLHFEICFMLVFSYHISSLWGKLSALNREGKDTQRRCHTHEHNCLLTPPFWEHALCRTRTINNNTIQPVERPVSNMLVIFLCPLWFAMKHGYVANMMWVLKLVEVNNEYEQCCHMLTYLLFYPWYHSVIYSQKDPMC